MERFRFNRVLRQQERKRLGIADDEMVLLTTSALSVQKNITNIFPALRALIREGVNVRYLIAGHGSKNDLAHMNAGITRFGLDRCVTYLGECLDTLPLYNAADVFVLLSDYEAFGISVIEAASCGLPCITSDAAAFPEIVSSDIGCRVGKDDTQGMIRLVRGLMPEKVRDRFRITARAAVEQRFNVRRNVGIFLE